MHDGWIHTEHVTLKKNVFLLKAAQPGLCQKSSLVSPQKREAVDALPWILTLFFK